METPITSLRAGGRGPDNGIAGPGMFISEKAADNGNKRGKEAECGGHSSLRLPSGADSGKRLALELKCKHKGHLCNRCNSCSDAASVPKEQNLHRREDGDDSLSTLWIQKAGSELRRSI
jgi:hypothetical protein